MVLLILGLLAAWFASGYLFWCAIQYGAIKYWYKAYKEDYSQSTPSRAWVKAKPIICACGPINLVIVWFSGLATGMSFYYGITLYFKVPHGTPLVKETGR